MKKLLRLKGLHGDGAIVTAHIASIEDDSDGGKHYAVIHTTDGNNAVIDMPFAEVCALVANAMDDGANATMTGRVQALHDELVQHNRDIRGTREGAAFAIVIEKLAALLREGGAAVPKETP